HLSLPLSPLSLAPSSSLSLSLLSSPLSLSPLLSLSLLSSLLLILFSYLTLSWHPLISALHPPSLYFFPSSRSGYVSLCVCVCVCVCAHARVCECVCVCVCVCLPLSI